MFAFFILFLFFFFSLSLLNNIHIEMKWEEWSAGWRFLLDHCSCSNLLMRCINEDCIFSRSKIGLLKPCLKFLYSVFFLSLLNNTIAENAVNRNKIESNMYHLFLFGLINNLSKNNSYNDFIFKKKWYIFFYSQIKEAPRHDSVVPTNAAATISTQKIIGWIPNNLSML